MRLNKPSLVTAALTAALPFLSDLIVFGSTGRMNRAFSEPGILVFNAAFAAFPFIIIGLIMAPRKSVTRALWVVFILTVILWGLYALTGWRYHIYQQGGGANIGLYMIMMIWPFICLILMGVIAKFREAPTP